MLVYSWICLVTLPDIRIFGGDDVINFGGPELSEYPPEWNLPFQLENLLVFEWPMVSEPVVDSLRES